MEHIDYRGLAEARRRLAEMDEYQVKRLGGLAGFAGDAKKALTAGVLLLAILGMIGGVVMGGATIENAAAGAVMGVLGFLVLGGPIVVIGTLAERMSPGQMRAAHLMWIGIIAAAIASRAGQ